MNGAYSDTPIYDRLKRERETTPIFDRLAEQYNYKKYEELVEPYQPPQPRTYSIEEYRALFKEENMMNNDWQALVTEFRKAMDLPNADGPRTLSTDEKELHIRLIRDEFEKELVPALEQGDLVGTYDAIIDVMYYLIGLAANSGMQIDPGFVEVHRSNMSKMDPVTKKPIKAGLNDPSGEPVGKVLKGPNYFEPKLGIILNEQSRNGHEDPMVYKGRQVPITLGIGGPKIGEGTLSMDNNGNVMMDGVMDDVSILPIIDHLGFSVTGVSVGDDSVQTEVSYVEDARGNRFRAQVGNAHQMAAPYDR